MKPSISTVHVCGPLGQALAIMNGETWLYEGNERRRPTSNDIRLFFDHGLEVRALTPVAIGTLDEKNVLSLLEIETQRFDALHGLLMGMDAELDENLRKRGMRRTNRVLANREVADFVERRFLRPAAQQVWDLKGARRLARAEQLSLVDQLYTIIDGPLLLQLEDEISVWASTRTHTSVERSVAVANAYEAGLVAALATMLNRRDFAGARAKILLGKGIKWDRHLAVHLLSRFVPSDKSHVITNTDSEPDDEVFIDSERDDEAFEPTPPYGMDRVRAQLSQLLDEYRLRIRRHRHRNRGETTAEEAFGVALKQVEWIAGRFESGHAERAWADLLNLARQQLLDGSPEKLAMSLTSLATRLAPRREVSLVLSDLAAMCAPRDSAVWNARAELLREWGQPADALTVYERTVEDFPQDVYARAGRAETLRSLGRFEEALAAYERTVEDFPQDVVARTGRAETLRSLGRFEDALAAHERTIQDFPENVFAQTGRAETLRSLGRFEEALAAYERTVQNFPQDVVVRNGRAETLRSLGRFEEALAAYERTVEDFSQNAVARTGRAETLRSLGRFEEALAAYERTVQDFPQDVFAQTGCAETLRSLGRFEEALAAYERIVQDFPQEVFARTGRAETLRSLGRFEEALAAYERTVEDFPQNAVARNGRAETLRSLGRFEEALAAYERTVEDFPQDVFARTGRAETLRSLGRFEEALAAYERTVGDFPQDAVARTGRAETLRSLGRFEEALAAYERAAQDFPWDTFVRIGRAAVLSGLGKFEEARKMLSGIEVNPRTPDDWVGIHILCSIEFREGATAELAARLEQFAKKCPYLEKRRYFETTLAVARIALRRVREAREGIKALVSRPGLDPEEIVALHLMEAHAEAMDGNITLARQSLLAASNVVTHEEFKLRRIRQEVERRVGNTTSASLSRPDEIAASDKRLVQLESDFWVDCITRGSVERRRAA